MRPTRYQRTITPKISNIPRQKTEETLYRTLYQLAVEKKRLQQELDHLNQRYQLITQRLETIETQIQGLETDVKNMATPQKPSHPQLPQPSQKPSESRPTFTLDY